jgi:hypothetical protein
MAVVVDVDRDRRVYAPGAAAASDLEPFEGQAQLGARLDRESEGDVPGGRRPVSVGSPEEEDVEFPAARAGHAARHDQAFAAAVLAPARRQIAGPTRA